MDDLTPLGVLVKYGKDLGLEGAKLQEFVEEHKAKEEQSVIAQREHELKMREKEEQSAFAQRREEREHELMMKEKEVEIRTKELELEERRMDEAGTAPQRAIDTAGANLSVRPKLNKFLEEEGTIDVYLDRFERFATTHGWNREDWALNLSALLTGKALVAYTSLSVDDSRDYDNVKKAILDRYQLNEEGFRRKFREEKPAEGETIRQFSSRFKGNFKKWIETAGVRGNFDGLAELIMKEQFMSLCATEIAIFIREKKPQTLEEIIELAEVYTDVHNVPMGGKKSAVLKKPIITPIQPKKDQGLPKCYICGKLGHLARFCRQRESERRVVTCFICNRSGHRANECRRDTTRQGARDQQRVERLAALKVVAETMNEGICHDYSNSSRDGTRSVEHWMRERREIIPNETGLSNGGCKVNGEKAKQTIKGMSVREVDYIGAPLEIQEGFVGEKKVNCIKDTGSTQVVVKRSLVEDKQLTGEKKVCVMMNNSKEICSVAEIEIDSPYLKGKVEAICMDDPIVDLIVGNVKSVAVENASAAMETRAMAKQKTERQQLTVVKPIEESKGSLISEQKEDASLKKYWEYGNEEKQVQNAMFYVEKGVLKRRYIPNVPGQNEVTQVVTPKPRRKRIMQLAHESLLAGHMGVKKTEDRVLSNFWWPGIRSDVDRWCKSCDVCQRMIPKGKVSKVPLGTTPLMGEAFDKVAIDLVGPINPCTHEKHRYLLTCVDYATRYPEAIALKAIDTKTVAEALLEIFCRVGFPKEIFSDRGTQFTSEMLAEVCRMANIKQSFTTPWHPAHNGMNERFNGTLKQMLKKMCAEKPEDWNRYIPAVLFAYREIPQASTGFSPFELLYGRTIRGPMEIVKELWTEEREGEVRNTYQYVIELGDRLKETCALARENLKDSAVKYKHHYDKKTRPREMKEGEEVLLLLPEEKNKLLLAWRGPYKIVKKTSPTNYTIEIGGKHKTFHVNLLKKYYGEELRNEIGAAVLIHEERDEEDKEEVLHPGVKQDCDYRDVKINPDLNDNKKRQLKGLIEEYRDIFTNLPGETNLEKHSIETTNDEPTRQKQYVLPYAMRKKVDEEVEEMLKLGIIERSKSNYLAPVVLVKKKDDS
ncbi:hypothetical protein SNEBB_003688, partial [Seison nebaliae]